MKIKTNFFIITLILSVISSPLLLKAQLSNKVFGGSQMYATQAIVETHDGGLLLGGDTPDFASSGFDIYVIKIADQGNGDTLWTKAYGGTGYERLSNFIQTPDSGTIFIGTTTSFGANGQDVYMFKTDSLGNVLWSKIYGGIGNDFGGDIIETYDTNYLITGGLHNSVTNNTDLFLSKINGNGDTLWAKNYEIQNQNNMIIKGKKIIHTSDSNYIVLATAQGAYWGAPINTIISKFDNNGNELWTNAYVNSNINTEAWLSDITPVNNGGYMMVGLNNYFELAIMKIDELGVIEWNKTSVDIEPMTDSTYVQIMNDGEDFVISALNMQNSYPLFIKSDTLGNISWINSFYSIFPMNQVNIIKNSNQNYSLLATEIMNDFSLFVLDSLGNSDCNQINRDTNVVVNNSTNIVSNSFTFQNSSITSNFSNVSTVSTNPNIVSSYPCFTPQEICIVTTDTLLSKNMVVWEKQFSSQVISHYNIYKESNVLGVYNLTGSVDADSLSEFVDISSVPAQNAERYKISQVSNGNIESELGSPHRTIHLTVNLGLQQQINLIWNHYEGLSFSTYNIWRGNGSQFNLIGSVNSSISSFTDVSPTPSDTIYLIEVVLPNGSCVSSKSSTTFNSIISNKASSAGLIISVEELSMFNNYMVYPNPSKDVLFVESNSNENTTLTVSLTNILGEEVFSNQFKGLSNNFREKIDMSSLGKGMYILSLSSEKGVKTYKIVKE